MWLVAVNSDQVLWLWSCFGIFYRCLIVFWSVTTCHSLVPRPHTFFVLHVAFSIIHRSRRTIKDGDTSVYYTEHNEEGWEWGYRCQRVWMKRFVVCKWKYTPVSIRKVFVGWQSTSWSQAVRQGHRSILQPKNRYCTVVKHGRQQFCSSAYTPSRTQSKGSQDKHRTLFLSWVVPVQCYKKVMLLSINRLKLLGLG